MKAVVNVDGACEPVNPNGIASYGFVVRNQDGQILKLGKGVVGEGGGMTNNVAEYTAAIKGLEWVNTNLNPKDPKSYDPDLEAWLTVLSDMIPGGVNPDVPVGEYIEWLGATLDLKRVKLCGDSQLLVRQVNGRYRVRSERIRPLYETLKEIIEGLETEFEAEWVPREQNEGADALSKEAVSEYIRTHDYRFNGHPIIECDECGAWMVVRKGKWGKFYGCSRYPKCRNTKSLEDETDAQEL